MCLLGCLATQEEPSFAVRAVVVLRSCEGAAGVAEAVQENTGGAGAKWPHVFHFLEVTTPVGKMFFLFCWPQRQKEVEAPFHLSHHGDHLGFAALVTTRTDLNKPGQNIEPSSADNSSKRGHDPGPAVLNATWSDIAADVGVTSKGEREMASRQRERERG